MKNNKTKNNKLHSSASLTASQPANTAKKAPKPMPEWIGKVLPIVVCVIVLVTMGVMLVSQEWEMLYHSQEMSLFLPNDEYWHTLNIYPGGLLQGLGCWATQYFFNPAMGVALLVALWAVIGLLSKYIFKLRKWAMLLTLLPALMLMAAVVQTGYWLYYTKLQGYFFVPTLGVLISLASVGIYRLIGGSEEKTNAVSLVRRVLALVWMGVFAWYGYQYMGAWSFLGIGLMAVPSTLAGLGKGRGAAGAISALVLILPIIAAIECIINVPRMAYANLYCQTQIDTIYKAAMPSFSYGLSDFPSYRMAYYMLWASFLPISLQSFLPLGLLKDKSRNIVGAVLLALLLVPACLFVKDRWYHDEAFQRELVMNRCVEEGDWEGVLDAAPAWTEADTLYTPTRAMVMMKNLALFRLGREGDDMFNYAEGAKSPLIEEYVKVGRDDSYNDEMRYYTINAVGEYERWTPDSASATPHAEQFKSVQKPLYAQNVLNVRLTQVGGKLLYFNYGKLNYCYRWCMEDGVEFGWKVEHLRFMARCALMKGEWKVAKKYLNLLKQTKYHKEWAEKYEAYIGHPELMEQDETLAPICKLKEYSDRLDGDNSLVELYLLRTFANGHGIDNIYQRATLMCALIMKDIDLFWPRLMEYVQRNGGDQKGFHLPRHYQEAAYLYCMLEPTRPSYMWPGITNAEAMKKFPFDESVKQSYASFMNFNARADISPLTEEQKRVAFQPYYANTFYYFYFLIRGQKTN